MDSIFYDGNLNDYSNLLYNDNIVFIPFILFILEYKQNIF